VGRLAVTMFSTLDGVMQAPGQLTEDPSGGFPFGGWQAPYAEAESGGVILEQILGADALLLGRTTYDIWVRHWPNAAEGDPVGAHFNGIPKFVASHTLPDETAWRGTTVVRDVPREVAALKQNFGEIRVWGSGELLTTLLAHGLVDVLDLWIYPVVLGSGRRVFRDGVVPAAFDAVAPPRGFANGSVLLSYRNAKPPRFGNM
jgi:dihydrofolate reductase